MKNKKLSTALYIAVLVFLIAAEALTAAILLRLEMLPDNYVIILAIALLLLAVMVGLLLFLPGRGKKVGNARRIIACVLALVLVCGCALVSKLAADAYAAIHAVTKPTDIESVNLQDMYVLVRADDPAQTLTDAVEYSFGVIGNYNFEQTQYALAEIEKAIGKAPAREEFATAMDVANALLNSEVDAAILNGINISLLTDEEGYEDFFDNVRVLLTIPDTEKDGTLNDPELKDRDVVNKPFAVYVSGVDTNKGVLNSSRSDVNILVVVNPQTKQVLMINTPRDFYVPHPLSQYGTRDKLTHLGLYGLNCSVDALAELYDVDVHYYVQVNYRGFEKMIDAIGGISIYSEEAFVTKIGKTQIYEGINELDGVKALRYARERRSVTGGDHGRGKNQMKVITAILEKMTSGTTIISNYSAILDSMAGMFNTNFEMTDISALVKMQLGDMAKWDIHSYSATGSGGSEITYSVPGQKLYVMHPSEASVTQAQELIDKVFDGQILTDADLATE